MIQLVIAGVQSAEETRCIGHERCNIGLLQTVTSRQIADVVVTRACVHQYAVIAISPVRSSQLMNHHVSTL